jgi:hypothetical protein
MDGDAGFLSQLPRRRWARVLALAATLLLPGCYATTWGPIPRPVTVTDGMRVKVPAGRSDSGAQEFDELQLYRAQVEGDSVISGVSNDRPVWVRVDDALIPLGRRYDGKRTALTLGAVVGVFGLASFLAAWWGSGFIADTLFPSVVPPGS